MIFFNDIDDVKPLVQSKIAPDASDNEWSVEGNLTENELLSIYKACESKLCSLLPRRYQDLLYSVTEVLTDYHAGGAITYNTSLYPVSNLKVYIDYPARRDFEIRNDSYTTDYDSITQATGEVTITADEGQRIYIAYDHTGLTQCYFLQDILVSYIAIEISRRFSFYQSDEQAERFNDWEKDHNIYLRDLRKYDSGIHELDKINVVGKDTDKKIDYSIFSRKKK